MHCKYLSVDRLCKKSKIKKGNKMKTTKLVIGIISIVLCCICFLQACALSIAESLMDDNVGAAAGILVSFCMLIAGIITISTRNGGKGGYAAGGFYLAGAYIAFNNLENGYADLEIWMILSATFGIVMIFCTAKEEKNAQKEQENLKTYQSNILHAQTNTFETVNQNKNSDQTENKNDTSPNPYVENQTENDVINQEQIDEQSQEYEYENEINSKMSKQKDRTFLFIICLISVLVTCVLIGAAIGKSLNA